MTNRTENNNTKGWIRSADRSHNHDSRVVALVRLLARQAAQKDYDDLLEKLKKQPPAQDKKDTIQ